MIPHITCVISGGSNMEFELELLLKSWEQVGRCKKYFCTVFAHGTVESKLIKSRAEIIEYECNPDLAYPWWTCPRWDVKPKGDIVIGLDSDVVVLNPVQPFLEESLAINKVRGVLGKNSPFESLESQWKTLFEICGVDDYEKYNHPHDGLECPYYINHGVVVMPLCHLERMRAFTKQAIQKVHSHIEYIYWFPQIITSLAIQMSNTPHELMPEKYNLLRPFVSEGYEKHIEPDTVFYHYSTSRDVCYYYIDDFIADHPKLDFLHGVYSDKQLFL